MPQGGVIPPGGSNLELSKDDQHLLPPLTVQCVTLGSLAGGYVDPNMGGMGGCPPLPNQCCQHGAQHCTTPAYMTQGSMPGDPMMGGMMAGLPPIEQQMMGNMQGLHDLSALRTPHGGIRTNKKTKQQRKEELFNKKRSRKALNKQLMSVDFGFLGPAESESSDDEMFTGVTLEPYQDHTQPSLLPPIKKRSLFPLQGKSQSRELSYQVSTEREMITSDEERSSQASLVSSSLEHRHRQSSGRDIF